MAMRTGTGAGEDIGRISIGRWKNTADRAADETPIKLRSAEYAANHRFAVDAAQADRAEGHAAAARSGGKGA
jgi:hypothetical protein